MVSHDVRHTHCGATPGTERVSRSQQYASQENDFSSSEVFLPEPASVANVPSSDLSERCIHPQPGAGCQSDSRCTAPTPIYGDCPGNLHDLPSGHPASGSDRVNPHCELLRLRPYGLGETVDQRACEHCHLAGTGTQ